MLASFGTGKPTPSVEKTQRSTRGSLVRTPPVADLAVDVRADDALVGGDGGLDGRVLLGGDPAEVDLRVVEDVALPARVGVDRDGDLDRQAGLAGDGRRRRGASTSAHGLLGRLADGQAAVEAEDELLGDGAVARRVEAGPGGGAGAVAEERVVQEAVALVVAPRRPP